jgi:hypothetical protein
MNKEIKKKKGKELRKSSPLNNKKELRYYPTCDEFDWISVINKQNKIKK